MGLGNPGEKYTHTRHNAGYQTVKLLVEEYKSEFSSNLNNLVETANIRIYNNSVTVIRPLIFMNKSGVVLPEFLKKYNIDLQNFLLVYDDVNLVPGGIKLKSSGGSGGHKGVESIIDKLENNNFPRIKIGIGHPGSPQLVSEYVLSSPKEKEELELLQVGMQKAKQAIKFWIEHGIHKTMNKYN